MSTIKLVEFRPEGMGPFMKYLEWLSQKKGWSWGFEVHPEFSWDVLKNSSAALVAPSLSSQIIPQLKAFPTQVRSVQYFDSFFWDGAWYPRILLHEALRRVLVAEARDLDIRAPAFVIGDDDEVRVVISVLADMGIEEIYLVGVGGQLQAHKDILSRSHVGIRFHLVDAEELTLQALSAGILVNTLDLTDQKSLLTDLSYFNFMKGSGYVLDLNLLPEQNLLLEEAEKASLHVLRPVLVAAAVTFLFLERIQVGEELTMDQLLQSWAEFLKESSSKF